MTDIAGHYSRTLIADRAAIDEKARTVSASLSTDTPVERFFGYEVLGHRRANVDLSRVSPSLPLLFNHNPDQVIGSVDNVRIEGGKLRGHLRFVDTTRANEVFSLIRGGHLRGISIGYQINEAQRDGEHNGMPLFHVTRWQLYEATVTPVPADQKAGIGRSLRGETSMDPDELKDETEGKKSRSERRRENRAKQLEDEILDTGEAFGERTLAENVVLRGGTVDDLKREILAKRNNVAPMPQSGGGGYPFESYRMMQEFGLHVSPARAKPLPAFGTDVREQRENAYRSGMWILGTLFGNEHAKRWCQSYGIRAMSEGILSAGGATVPAELSSAIIDLQEMYGTFRQEAEMMPMNSDTLAVPRHTGGVTAYFVGENATITDSDAGWDDVTLTARKLAALTRVSTELAEDSVVDVAAFLANEFGKRFAEKEDDCGFNGDGTSTYGGIYGIRPKLIDGNHTVGAIDAASNHDTLPEIDGDDLDKIMAALPAYALPNAKWYCSQAANQQVFQSIARAAGGASVIETGGTIIRSYAGYPIIVNQICRRVRRPTTRMWPWCCSAICDRLQ